VSDSAFPIQPDELSEIVLQCDADGIIVSWNRAGKEITGYGAEEVIGYHLDSILTEDSRRQLSEILIVRRSGSVLPGMPLRLVTNFGMDVPVEVTSIPRYKDAEFQGWLLILRDVTIKVQQQEELDKLDLLYRSLVENSPAIIYVLDSAGRVVFINETAEVLLGYAKSELLGRELSDIVHPEDRERAYWPLRERRRFPRATQNCEFRLVTKGGVARRFDLDFIYVSLNSIGLRIPTSTPEQGSPLRLGTQGIARDITELVLFREFSRQVSCILPICSVCHKIRIEVKDGQEWVHLDSYVRAKTGAQFSHTFCPDHIPAVE
jgi:PAS domain S-box-containing protein